MRNECGCMHYMPFLQVHLKLFSTLWIVGKYEVAHGMVEGCEHFFNLSGYGSSPQHTRLGVRNYKRLAMLTSILKVIHVDPE